MLIHHCNARINFLISMNLKKTIINNLKYIAVGMVVAISISYAYAAWGTPAGTYTDPTGTPPANNIDMPLNVGATDQVKSIGSCVAGNCGGLSLNGAFLASENAQFNQQVFFNGVLGGGTAPLASASAVRFGGTDSAGYTQGASIVTSGGVNATVSMQGSTLANADGTKTLCADSGGHIVFCNIVDLCSNIPGTQTTVPAGDLQNKDGTCSPAPKEFLAFVYGAQYNNPNIIGNVGGSAGTGNIQYTVPGTVDVVPYVDQMGLYDDVRGSNNWVYDNVPGVTAMTFTGDTRLLTVGEAGSYDISIADQGTIGIQGKFPSDANVIGADFYLKVNGQYYRLDNNSSTLPHEQYPVPGKSKTDFAGYFTDTGNGNTVKTVPFNFAFDQTFQLNPGDTVDMYAFFYGTSTRNSFFDSGGVFSGGPFSNGNFNNFYDSIQENQATFKIIETPSQ